MNNYILLLRGINVGGSNKLPMATLVNVLEDLDGRDVKTYIQSGNAVFRSKAKSTSRLEKSIAAALDRRCGFQPHVLVLPLEQLGRAMRSNPFPEAEAEPKSLHLYFLAASPKRPDFASLDRLKKQSERYRLDGAVFYLHAPDGIGRSRLAAGVERILGVAMTGRNWRTVCKLQSLAEALSS